jgi:hypothetical protein
LANIDQARRVKPLIVNDDVWTTNFWGDHCAEDNKFCNAALSIIRASINHHGGGGEVKVRETLNSDVSKWSRYTFKLGASAGVCLINPAAGMTIGAGAWGAGKLGQGLCDSDRGKAFWGTVSDMGNNAFWGGFANRVESSLINDKGFCEFSRAHSSSVADAAKEFTQSVGMDGTWHSFHRARGINYDSNCSMCNS